MDRQIRRLGLAFVALFSVLFAQVGYVQVVAADRIANEPANAARQIAAEYAVERGQILAANRTTVLAESDPNPDPDSPYRFLRRYPGKALWGQITGYYSQIYGRTGLEQAMNPYLSGTANE
ncbi:MAG: penicillin-binding protein 2, partial [Actinomycetota bacterium]|nr:penicillin-binding protein 2 [Actinomycetota bacterium]